MSDFTSFVKRVGRHISDASHRREAEDELLDHLEAVALQLQRQGFSLEEAQERAMQQFGDPDVVGKGLGRVHNGIKFRYFAVGGLLWYAAGAVLFGNDAIYMDGNWLEQLPVQVLGLPHWFALQSPQVRSLSGIFEPFARFVTNHVPIAPRHFDAVIGALILTAAAYGVYRLARAFRTPEARQAWSLLRVAFKN